MRNLAVIVQTKNPRINRYVKIDRVNGKILGTKKTSGPYKNIQIIRRKKETYGNRRTDQKAKGINSDQIGSLR